MPEGCQDTYPFLRIKNWRSLWYSVLPLEVRIVETMSFYEQLQMNSHSFFNLFSYWQPEWPSPTGNESWPVPVCCPATWIWASRSHAKPLHTSESNQNEELGRALKALQRFLSQSVAMIDYNQNFNNTGTTHIKQVAKHGTAKCGIHWRHFFQSILILLLFFYPKHIHCAWRDFFKGTKPRAEKRSCCNTLGVIVANSKSKKSLVKSLFSLWLHYFFLLM